MLTRPLTRNLTRGFVSSPDMPDPLADIPVLFDLRTHNGDLVPTGIAPSDGAQNPLWTGIASSAAQATAGKQPLTRFAGDGTPFLEFDGSDEAMLTPHLSTLFDAEGSLAVAFYSPNPTNFSTPVGGDYGPTLCSVTTTDSWGPALPAGFGPQSPFPTNSDWAVLLVTWLGTAFTTQIQRADGSTDAASGTLPAGFSSGGGFMGIGAHISSAPFSYFRGGLIAVRGSDQQWTPEQCDEVIYFYSTLLPT